MDFPPRIEICVDKVPTEADSETEPLYLCIEGLNKDYIFKLKSGIMVFSSIQIMSLTLITIDVITLYIRISNY